jgi:response regulator RpfG family c-di-GMP phosphodiesterase
MNNESQFKFDRVMIIDDTQEDLYITSHVITRSCYGRDVIKFDLATDALKYLIENNSNTSLLPQAMFVDIFMPIMNGFEFLEEYEILQEKYNFNCEVYVLSSSFDSRDINKAKSYKNVKNFIEKPLRKEALLAM